MVLLQHVDKVVRLTRAILEIMVVLLFATMVTLVFSQVWVRFFTDSALTWSEELSRFVMIWLVYAASIITYADKSHIIMDSLLIVLKGRTKIAVQLASQICVLAFAVIAVLGAIELMPLTATHISPANNIVMANVYVVIPISMIFMGLICAKEICQSIMALKNPQSEKKVTP